jgi:hypothetical protein
MFLRAYCCVQCLVRNWEDVFWGAGEESRGLPHEIDLTHKGKKDVSSLPQMIIVGEY